MGSITFGSPPDYGIVKALKLSNLSRDGLAIEFGAGTARNLAACSKAGYSAKGYDVAPWIIEEANESLKQQGVSARVEYGDVLALDMPAATISIAMVGTVIYWPKSVVESFVAKLWNALKINGILHIEFATVRDCTFESEFCEFTCFPLPEDGYEMSFGHYCGYDCNANHPGVIGVSYWKKPEIAALIKTLGNTRQIHWVLHEWNQIPEEGVEMFRSFEKVTVQKLG